MTQLDFRATASYNNDFNHIHSLSAFAGLEASKIDRSVEAYQGWGICYDNGKIPFNDWKLFKQMNEEGMNYYSVNDIYRRSMAYFATANYGYKSRYVVNGTIRYEGSNKLGKAQVTLAAHLECFRSMEYRRRKLVCQSHNSNCQAPCFILPHGRRRPFVCLQRHSYILSQQTMATGNFVVRTGTAS